MLDLHLARHEKRKDFEVRGRLIARDLFNRLLALMAEVQQQRLHELLVQQMTRAVPVAMRISRNPLLEGHLALHVHRVVLNVSKCLMGLAPVTCIIPLGGRQLADRESEHCQPDANEILPG
jgi:hypothetical protein